MPELRDQSAPDPDDVLLVRLGEDLGVRQLVGIADRARDPDAEDLRRAERDVERAVRRLLRLGGDVGHVGLDLRDREIQHRPAADGRVQPVRFFVTERMKN